MHRRFQISLTSGQERLGAPPRRTPAGRAKRLAAGLMITTLALAILVAAVILGSIIAVAAGVVLALALTVGIVRLVLLKDRQ